MRAVQQEVTVRQVEEGRPLDVYWKGRAHRVQVILDEWRYGGRWWLDEVPRTCFLVQAGPLTAELHHEDSPGGRWWLARMQD
ncbi:hypothetical protein F8S09_16625 [Deinococcus sp. SDU3-2]|uniref:DUF6504 domain-containing protein n=1 Tax=Deinococcus terrestris TaxID=2651870 RepID=A0A7X1NYR7_9DEIO|nr:DUF6504 family protein [Deinococcus terrestris]MPY68282.1 hypothetical protein [Deinococcus terrestris]